MSELTKNPIDESILESDAAPAASENHPPSAEAGTGSAPGTSPGNDGSETSGTGEAGATGSSTAPAATPEELEAAIVEALQTVYDPEIPVNIYELGLIYDIDIDGESKVAVKMTLTSPACPVAGSLPGEVEQKVKSVDGVADAEVEVVWDPVWNPSMMSESAKLQLGMF